MSIHRGSAELPGLVEQGPLLRALGIEMPLGFPREAYEAIQDRALSKREKFPMAWNEFACGWISLAYRFRAMALHETTFAATLGRAGGRLNPDDRYHLEQNLFAFFVNGFSVVESLSYSLWMIGAMIEPGEFPDGPEKMRQEMKPERAAARYSEVFPESGVGEALAATVESGEFKEWTRIKDVLHLRSSPHREFDKWGDSIFLDEVEIGCRREWLSGNLGGILAKADRFTGARF